MTRLEEYKKINKELSFMNHAVNLMYWDMQTIAPEGGKERLSESITYFSTEIFKKFTSDDYYKLVCDLSVPEEFDKLDDVMKFDIRKTRKDLDEMRRIPADFYEEYVKTTTASSMIWPKAKQTSDYSLYEEPLKNTIEAVKKYQKYKRPDMEVYDSLIDQFEEGMDTKTIDKRLVIHILIPDLFQFLIVELLMCFADKNNRFLCS